MSKPTIGVEAIGETSAVLDQVKRLWRSNSDTLGFFPEGAFADRAARGQVLVALGANNDCLGYLIYHTGKDRANINHLCVDPEHRGRGIASLLIDELCKRTRRSCRGIGLSCRSDFTVNKLWPKLSFVASHEKQGRSADGYLLTSWWLDYGHMASASDDTIVSAVIDANVFFDLDDDTRQGSEESQGLWADWLQPHVRLCIDGELLNEIARHPNPETRRKRRKFTYEFTPVICGQDNFRSAHAKLKVLLSDWTSERDESDLRHLARTIASSATVFITRDKGLLEQSDQVYDAFGLSIVRPSEFIGRIDEMLREAAYQPSQLAGTRIGVAPLRDELAEVVSQFQAVAVGERQGELERKLRSYLSSPRRYECRIVTAESSLPLALVVMDRQDGQPAGVPILRVANTRLGGTVARALLRSLFQRLASNKHPAILVQDEHGGPTVAEALADLGFLRFRSHWLKVCLASATTCHETASLLGARFVELGIDKTELRTLHDSLTSEAIRTHIRAASEIEHLLWPAKLTDCEIPTYIMAIYPGWAQHLFDEGLASQTLFGADTELALNPESVYYRRPRPSGLTSPARLLWYVTEAKRSYSGTMRLRACSRIEEVAIGKPKALFRRFRRLGVYEWRHVFELAKHDVNAEIQAVRFSDTEVFDNPMGWDRLQAVLRSHGVKSTFQSPVRIRGDVFARVYRECRGLEAGSGTKD